jgi:hypothetical protein
MLLETLDIKIDDIVIYSQNIFDLENNFKIIFKDDPKKKIRKIGYYDVCHFVNEYTPKNLIVYRMMTNITAFSLHTSKFGFKVFIGEVPEIIYFDPVFAIRELEEYPGTVDENLRFRIQQIGLTTLSRVDNVPNFAEIYSIDLRPYEAKYQKDKVFADAIFALNVEYNTNNKNVKLSDNIIGKPIAVIHEKNEPSGKIKKENPDSNKTQGNSLSNVFYNVRSGSKELRSKELIPKKKEEIIQREFKEEKSVAGELSRKEEDIKFIKHEIAEDKNFDYKQILKMKFIEDDYKPDAAKEFPKIIRHDSEKKYTFREFLQTNISPNVDKKKEEKGRHLTDLFKSPEPLIKLVEERQKEKIVLKLNKK